MILGKKIIEWLNIGQWYQVEIGALNVKINCVAVTLNMLLGPLTLFKMYIQCTYDKV